MSDDGGLHARCLGHVNCQAKSYVRTAEASNQRLERVG
jgi:hypothetical protein